MHEGIATRTLVLRGSHQRGEVNVLNIKEGNENIPWLMLVLFWSVPALLLAHASPHHRTLVVSGHPGELAVLDVGGRSYIEIEALARLANGSLSSNGDQMVLTLSAPPASTGGTASSTSHSPLGLTKDFIRAGIEEMSAIREWRSTLTNAVQRGYPVTEDWIASFRDRSRQSLRLVSVAASTDADRNVFQLMTNVFNNMNTLSDRFLEDNRTRTYIPPDALNNDPLDQRILNCAQSLAAMAASGQFIYDASCH
jgi:hypothetical protein